MFRPVNSSSARFVRLFGAAGIWGLFLCDVLSAGAENQEHLTFNKDIAPLIFNHCTACHRPGQSAPFPFLSYHDVAKHLKDIITVTQERYMPPWLPEPGHGDFLG